MLVLATRLITSTDQLIIHAQNPGFSKGSIIPKPSVKENSTIFLTSPPILPMVYPPSLILFYKDVVHFVEKQGLL